jgi:hypothetical protein
MDWLDLIVPKPLFPKLNPVGSAQHKIAHTVRDAVRDRLRETPMSETEKMRPENRKVIIITDNPKHAKSAIGGRPRFLLSQAKELFTFPPQHPIANRAYAMAEMMPNTYVELGEFHEYFKQMKLEAFINICANLGAKEIRLESAEINGRAIDMHGDINYELEKVGAGVKAKVNKETGVKVTCSFSEGNKTINPIDEADARWLETEPTWRSMYKLRQERHLQSYEVDYNYLSDMGINAELLAEIKGYGVKVGGSISNIAKIKLKYQVIFW